MAFAEPYLITFPVLGKPSEGHISVAEEKDLPFKVARVFWTYGTPETLVRGRHAHHKTEQLLIAVSGRILVTTEHASGVANTFILDKPSMGLYIPPNVWHTMQYSGAAVQVVLASTAYDENDYIRDYAAFKRVWK